MPEQTDGPYSGTFWIARKECVICNVCHAEAPGLIADTTSPDDHSEVSTVVRQPVSKTEYEQMFSAVSICMVDCIYYEGEDPRILSLYERVGRGLKSHEIWPKKTNTDGGDANTLRACCGKKKD